MSRSNSQKKLNLNKLFYLTISIIFFCGLALMANAQAQPGGGGTTQNPADYGLTATARGAGIPTYNTSPIIVVAKIVNTLLGVLGAVLVILIIYAGFLWMTAAGEEQKISKAKNLLGNAIVGLIIILAAFAIASFAVKSIAKSTGYSGLRSSLCGDAGGNCSVMCYTYEHSIGEQDCTQPTEPLQPPVVCCVPN